MRTRHRVRERARMLKSPSPGRGARTCAGTNDVPLPAFSLPISRSRPGCLRTSGIKPFIGFSPDVQAAGRSLLRHVESHGLDSAGRSSVPSARTTRRSCLPHSRGRRGAGTRTARSGKSAMTPSTASFLSAGVSSISMTVHTTTRRPSVRVSASVSSDRCDRTATTPRTAGGSRSSSANHGTDSVTRCGGTWSVAALASRISPVPWARSSRGIPA